MTVRPRLLPAFSRTKESRSQTIRCVLSPHDIPGGRTIS